MRTGTFAIGIGASTRSRIARAFSDHPDLVLCDIAMPVLDGFGLAVALRHNAHTKRLPLVFLTGENEPWVERHAYDAGALGFFTKPFEPSALISFIKRSIALPDSEAARIQAV